MELVLALFACAPSAGEPAVAAPVAPNAAPVAPAPVPLEPAPAPAPVATFRADVRPLTEAESAAMIGVSWHEGCPVPLADLRHIEVVVHHPDGTAGVGVLVAHADAAAALTAAFRDLWDAGYPIAHMEPIEAFHGSDHDSMVANNTSAFNCRTVAGSTKLSQHAYGRAVDVNPLWNPWVRPGEGGPDRVDPPEGAPWADRSRTDPGVIHAGDATVAAFRAAGWGWGGTWAKTRDYQHFSQNGE
jgi:poly-gamma-glutamate synthesis protein (capsule biosynthesis protein)